MKTGQHVIIEMKDVAKAYATGDGPFVALRNVNLQIHRLAPVYTKLESVNVFHHPEVPPDCRGIDSSSFVKELAGGQFVDYTETKPGLYQFKDNQGGTPLHWAVKKDHRILAELLRQHGGYR